MIQKRTYHILLQLSGVSLHHDELCSCQELQHSVAQDKGWVARPAISLSNFKCYSILNTYQLFFQELNKPLFIYGALKYLMGDITFRCTSRENWVLLPLYEHSMTNTSMTTQCPSICALVCMLINTGFIEIYSRNIPIFHLPSSLQTLVPFHCGL